jgi:molybdopterin converting factor small subunit
MLRMPVTLEFFGLVRQWAGRPSLTVEASTLGDALGRAAAEIPQLCPACLLNGRLQPGYLANVNCQRFTTDPATPLDPGDAVLILTADVGG